MVTQYDQITMNSMDEWIGDESKQDYKINHNKLYSKNSLSFSSKADRKTKSVGYGPERLEKTISPRRASCLADPFIKYNRNLAASLKYRGKIAHWSLTYK